MAGACPAVVVSAVTSLLQSDIPMLEKMAQLTKTLKAQNLAWVQDITPGSCLVHPSNRAGQMLSVDDVWSKGLRMVSLGVQKQILMGAGSVCIELSQDVARKAEQLEANRRLVALSHGQLAPVTGEERFLTLASSRTTAFFKAVEAGCQCGETSVHIKQLEDVLGGWPWLVLSHLVEQACPGVPLFYQLASNASASGQKQISEVEACGLMAMRVKSGASLESAVAELKQADPACRGSLDAISHYVSRYGGGQTMDLMMFLVDFSLWACSYMARHAGFLPCTCVSCCWVRLRQVFRYFDAGDGGNESPGILRLQEPEHSLCFRALGTAA